MVTLLGKPIQQVTEQDLQDLVARQVSEGPNLDYKQDVPGDREKDKRKFLKAVSAMANTSGGCLIFGVEEQNGIATAIPGLQNFDPDKDIRRLEDMILQGIHPRLAPPPIFHEIRLARNGRYVLIIGIPRSLAGPHSITSKNDKNAFLVYARGYRQNYPMDIEQLRKAILQMEAFPTRLQMIRKERLDAIRRGAAPIPLTGGPKLVIHYLPASALRPGLQIGIARAKSNHDLLQVAPGPKGRYSVDGFIYPAPDANGRVPDYLMVFRSGLVELVRSGTQFIPDGRLQAPGFERFLFDTTKHCLNALRDMGGSPPIWVMVTLLGFKGVALSHSLDFLPHYQGRPIDRDPLEIPEVRVEHFDVDLHQALRPLLDMLWQSAGHSECYHYDKDGRWDPSSWAKRTV